MEQWPGVLDTMQKFRAANLQYTTARLNGRVRAM
jgi:hypothetical protein